MAGQRTGKVTSVAGAVGQAITAGDVVQGDGNGFWVALVNLPGGVTLGNYHGQPASGPDGLRPGSSNDRFHWCVA
ncbi:MAG TPA: hypothetical protein VKV39_06650 [Candidatus Sulfotelmatobacter sp.]|nr:hypothetical protein [Candidatus Sulfotelmatobacter sp.]